MPTGRKAFIVRKTAVFRSFSGCADRAAGGLCGSCRSLSDRLRYDDKIACVREGREGAQRLPHTTGFELEANAVRICLWILCALLALTYVTANAHAAPKVLVFVADKLGLTLAVEVIPIPMGRRRAR